MPEYWALHEARGSVEGCAALVDRLFRSQRHARCRETIGMEFSRAEHNYVNILLCLSSRGLSRAVRPSQASHPGDVSEDRLPS